MSGVLAKQVGNFTNRLRVTAVDVIAEATGPGTSGLVTSNPATAPMLTPSGGTAPYTYSWTRLSGDTPAISNSTAQNPTWSATVADGATNTSSWQVTVTDAVGRTTVVTISVQLSYFML
jgi:hypothetical protein